MMMKREDMKEVALKVGGQLAVAITAEYLSPRSGSAFSFNNLQKDFIAIAVKNLVVRPAFQSTLMDIAYSAGLGREESKLLISFLEFMATFGISDLIQGKAFTPWEDARSATIYAITGFALDELYTQLNIPLKAGVKDVESKY